MVTFVMAAVSVHAPGHPLLDVLSYNPPPNCPAMGFRPSAPAVLPLNTVQLSITRFTELKIPPPEPAELLPEIRLPWITVWRELGVFVNVKIPPPIPRPVPFTCVAWLLRTLLL